MEPGSGGPPNGRCPAWQIIDRPTVRAGLLDAVETSRTTVVVGSAGVGKTRLVTDLAITRPGVSRIAGTPSRPAIPGAAVSALVQTHDTVVPPAGLVAALGRLVLRGELDTLVVDDVHDLDEVSAAVLHHCSQARDLRMILILREDRALPEPLISTVRRDDTTWVRIPAATPAEVEAIVRRVLAPAVDTAAVEHLRRVSAGNLLYLRHLVEGSVQSGALAAEGGLWIFRRPPEGTPLLADVLRRRFAPLSAAAREVADLLAVAGPVAPAVLARLGAEDATEELEDAALLAPPDGTGTVDLAHPVFRDRLVADLGPARRRRLLTGLVEAVGAGPRDAARDLRLAVWRHQCGLDTRPDEDLAAAGTALAGRQPELALELATRAWERGGAEWQERGRAGLLAARCHEQLGETRRAVALYRELEEAELSPVIRAKATARRAECLRGPLGDPAAARRLLAEASTFLTEGPSCQLVRAQVAVGLFCDGDLSAATAITTPLLDTAVTDPDVLASTAVVASHCYVHLDRPHDVLTLVARTAGLTDSADVVATTTPDTVVLSGAIAQARLGRRDAADEIIDRMSRSELALASPVAGAFADFARGTVARLTDRPVDAEDAFTRSAVGFREAGLPGFAEWSEIGGLLAATDLAETGLSERLSSIHASRQPDYGLYTPELLRAEARVFARAGLADEARHAWRRAAEVAVSRQDWLSAVESGLDLLGAGELDDLEELIGALPVSTSPSADAVRTGARAARDGPDALGRVAGTLAVTRPVRAADTWAYAARLAVDADEPFAAHALHARRLARSVPGLTRPAWWLPVALSAREEEIAVLAAEGLTNPEIAGRLGLVPKTVENHLGHVFRKLGLTGREDLAATPGSGPRAVRPRSRR